MIATLQRRTVIAGGFTTSYVEAGDPANETIVLLHDGAFGATAELCWGEVMVRLADRYHVVAPDLLGWGGTDKVVFLDRAPYASRISHIRAFCEKLNIDKANFAGVSFGGSMILRAMTNQDAGWPMLKAVSIAGAGGAYREPAGMAALGEYTPSLEEAARITGLIVSDVIGLEENIRARYEASLVPGHWEAMMAPRLSNPATTRASSPDTFFEDLAQTTAPLLLVEGTKDPLMEPGWAAKTAGNNQNITTLVADYGHEPNIEAPEWTANIIHAFLSEETK